MTYLHLHRPEPSALTRCHGSGLLTWSIRCLGCEDCGPVAAGEDVADVPMWHTPPMDPEHAYERLLWIEARGLAVAAESRRLRRRWRPYASPTDVAAEVARLELETRSREDEIRVWRLVHPPARRTGHVVALTAILAIVLTLYLLG
jgi:hypothetical protein